jgi:dephospho-CoA kinase
MLIGITGQIGTGKTEVANLFKKYGAHVISADEIGKNVVEKNPAILKQLVSEFGPEILTDSGRLRRKKLGVIAFSSDKNKERLNRIVHPPLLKELHQRVKSAKKNYKCVVIDAALLIDWGWHRKVDLTILVHAGREIILNRLSRKGFSREEAKMRLKSQLKYSTLRKCTDIVIFNNKSIESLERKVQRILTKLTERC